MKLTEKHIISPTHEYFEEIDEDSFLSKNLYNRGNYIIKQEFIKTSKEIKDEREKNKLKEDEKISNKKGQKVRKTVKRAKKKVKRKPKNKKKKHAKWIRYNELQKMLQTSKDPDYYALPAKVSQQVLMQLDKNWKSFFKSIREWTVNPSKFTGKPSLPQYKHKTQGRNILTYTLQSISGGRSKGGFKNNILHLAGTNIKIKTNEKNIKQVRIVPIKNNRYKIEVIYEQRRKINKSLNKKIIASVDIGVNNLSAVTSNHNKWTPLLINGRPLKSINQYFNKKKAEMLSELMIMDEDRRTSKQIDTLTHKRNMKIDDYLHKTSNALINLLVPFQIGVLVIGKNPNWKQDINIGTKNNQNFVSIPFARFIDILKYKCDLIGMKVITREEAHTSKCSFIDKEEICHHEKYVGRRIKRGLFKSKDRILINSDCNGSGNILRKEFPNAFADGIEGVVVRPVRINIPVDKKLSVSNYLHKLVA